MLSLARAFVISERCRHRRRSSSPPLFLNDKPPPELFVVVGAVANPSSLSLAPSCRHDCLLEQPSHAPPWCAPLRPPHRRPEPSIKFAVISSRFQAKPCEKPRPGAPDSVNSSNSAAAHRRSLAVGAPPNPLPPSDQDPMVQIQSNLSQPSQYQSALVCFQKKPCSF
jgi:hypothetical protein